MILLNKVALGNPERLRERRVYLESLINEMRPNVSPSSEEWVSAEFWSGHKTLLRKEVEEIDVLLRKLTKKEEKDVAR